MTPTGWKQSFGRWGEDQAANYLEQQGVTLCCRNYRCPAGEIDLIGKDAEGYLFVEVKTRSSNRFGYPEAAVNARKKEHIIAAGLHFLQEQAPDPDALWRVDVVAVVGSPRQAAQAEIVWYQNALD